MPPPADRPEPTRVVIADDHPATCRGIRRTLERAGMVVSAEASTPDEAVQAVLHHRPDVALLDVIMPPGDGIAAARRIRDEAPGIAVIMLSASADPAHVIDALRAGARGYLLKDTDPDRLASAIEGVLAGESAIPRTLVPALIAEIARPPAGRVDGSPLTPREHQVMAALARGLRTAEAAAALGLSEVTVRRHLSAAAAKLGATTREDALALYRTAGSTTTD
jgi:DNA-binding NarL/FixJ family response regulator